MLRPKTPEQKEGATLSGTAQALSSLEKPESPKNKQADKIADVDLGASTKKADEQKTEKKEATEAKTITPAPVAAPADSDSYLWTGLSYLGSGLYNVAYNVVTVGGFFGSNPTPVKQAATEQRIAEKQAEAAPATLTPAPTASPTPSA